MHAFSQRMALKLSSKKPNCQPAASLSSWQVQGQRWVPRYPLPKAATLSLGLVPVGKHHQTQPALGPPSSRDWPMGPGTSGVSSTSVSDFNTVRISTTHQIRQVVGTYLSGVSLKAPPILATFNFNIIYWHILSWSRGKHCPNSQLCGVLGCSPVLQPSPTLLSVVLAAEGLAGGGGTALSSFQHSILTSACLDF